MMADIELVIKIPEYYYENSIKKKLPIYLSEDNIVAILTKGHGRLIDADLFVQEHPLAFVRDVIEDAPTIIEADKAEGRDKE